MKKYSLSLEGLADSKGEIRSSVLNRLIQSLTETSRRILILLAYGNSGFNVGSSRWIRETTEFTFTGIEDGSTRLALKIPRLRDLANGKLSQMSVLGDQPEINLNHTAFDLIGICLQEVQTPAATGTYFDEWVLKSLSNLQSLDGKRNLKVTLEDLHDQREVFDFDDSLYPNIEARRRQIPSPEKHTITGKIDEIRHSKRQFVIQRSLSKRLIGNLPPDRLDQELLRDLWGKDATVSGLVQFKPNGQPRYIEASQILLLDESQTPFVNWPESQPKKRIAEVSAFDPKELVGSWPDDEPLDQLIVEANQM